MKKKLILIILVVFCLLNTMVYAETSTEVLSNDYYTNSTTNYKFKLPVGWSVSEGVKNGSYTLIAQKNENSNSVFYLMLFETTSNLFDENFIFQTVYSKDSTYKEISKEVVIIDNKDTNLRCFNITNSNNIKMYLYNIILKDEKGYLIITTASNEKEWQKNKDIYKQCLLSVCKMSNKTDTKDVQIDINNSSTTGEIMKYLEENYSELDTTKGTTNFNYSIYENKSIMSPYDYWIKVKYDSPFFYDIKYSNEWTNSERTKVKKELKDFMETIGKDLVGKLPDKKLYGGYYDSWYKYPNLRVDLIARRYYSWTNYNQTKSTSMDEYSQTKPSSFRWWDFIDDDL